MTKITKDDVLGCLKAGDWLFDLIAPQFKFALESSLSVSSSKSTTQAKADFSLFALTCLTYRPHLSPIPELLENNHSDGPVAPSNPNEHRFWAQVVSTAHASATFASPSRQEVKALTSALQLIKSHDVRSHLQIKKWISHFCGFEASDSRSFSHPHFFGCIFIDLRRHPIDLAISIVHESAHQELFLLNLLDRLVPLGADFNLAHAPFQRTARPPIGRLHSSHALFRMIPFENSLSPEKAKHHKNILRQTIETFSEGELTPLSRELLNEVYLPSVCLDDPCSNDHFREICNVP